MKKIILFLCFLFSVESFACVCLLPTPIEEFMDSDYVFKGKVKKIVPLKNKERKVIFEILTLYKGKERIQNPKEIITFAHFEYGNTCAWETSVGETWVVFSKEVEGKNRFHGMCSHSNRYNKKEVTQMLKNLHKFDKDAYYFGNDIFSEEKLKEFETDLSAFEKFQKNQRASIFVFVNTEGEIDKIVSHKNFNENKQYDPIFGLIRKENSYPEETFSEIEQILIEMIKKHKNDFKICEKEGKKVSFYDYFYIGYNQYAERWVLQV